MLNDIFRILGFEDYEEFSQNELFKSKIKRTRYTRFRLINVLGLLTGIALIGIDLYSFLNGKFELTMLNRTLIASHLFLIALIIPIVMGWRWEIEFEGLSNKQIRTYNRISFFFIAIGLLGIAYIELFQSGNIIPFLVLLVLINTLLISDPKKLLLKNLIAIGLLGVAFWINDQMHDFNFISNMSIAVLIALASYIGASMGIHLFVQEFDIQQNLSSQCRLLKHSLEREVNLKNAEIEMAVSSARLNPHFIFNILNSIKLYIVKNSPDKAAEFLNKFANLIRITLRNANNSLIPLQKEIQFCKTYLELERFRLKEKFDYEIIKSENLNPANYKIPPLFCQVFLENAVWHGIMPKEYEDDDKGKIILSFKEELDHIVITVEDNGMGRSRQNGLPKSVNGKKSMGLFLLRSRLENFNKIYGTDAEFILEDIKRLDGLLNGTMVTLKFPKIGGMVEMTS